MNSFVTFRHKSTGVLADYPEHYENHPVFGSDLERYTPSDEYEEDKTVVETHAVPVEQRITKTAKPVATANDKKEN